MKTAKVSDIVGIINKKFPFRLAENWDNVGLQVGDQAAEVRNLMVALDPLPDVTNAAIAADCQLLVTHHPLIFLPLNNITTSTSTGCTVLRSVSAGLAILAMHTNYDIANDGLNDLLGRRIGLTDLQPLKTTGHAELVKLVVFVPNSHLEKLRSELAVYSESIGNYSECSFATVGEGCFRPLEGSRPAIGSTGFLEKVAESRLEMLVAKDNIPRAIRKLISVHPYEEPAFDCYPLLNEGAAIGIGRTGIIPECTMGEFCQMVKASLGCKSVRAVGNPDRKVKKIAICSGSGGSLVSTAVRAGADLLLTGDIKYHDAREAEASGIALIDAGHFATEHLMVEDICSFLRKSLQDAGYSIKVLSSDVEQEPFLFL